ncbi:MAG: 2-oxoacid:acceptor oxidoreductase family protein [bacterium]
MKIDPRFLKEEGWEVFTGNELFIKGLLETEGGTHLWTGYPGSPVAGFFDCIENIQALLKKHGIRAFISNNEALAAAALNGSQMAGLRGIAVMKSVGMHVAADALALGNMAGAHPEGGVMVVMGDDPWNDSTQVPTDSRYLCKHLHMPVLEPSTNQEIKDWVELGFKLSRKSELYIGYLVTTNQGDGGGSVQTRHNHFPRINAQNQMNLDTSQVDFEKSVLLPPRTSRREQSLTERYQRLWRHAREHGVNRLLNADKQAPIGFVTSALAYSYLVHALDQMGALHQFPILKLGITYPIDPESLNDLKRLTSTLIVVEERRGFIEEQLAQIISQKELPFKIYGKTFPGGRPGIPERRGLNSSILVELLAPMIRDLNERKEIQLDLEPLRASQRLIKETAQFEIDLALRTPTFCPGCPHRDSASVLLEIKRQFRDAAYMRKHYKREPMDIVFHGDTGCYTMLMFEPTRELMHNYSGMGLGGGTGIGIDAFIKNKQVVFMGDSTFFHSGQAAISNSLKNGQDITYIILDNKTTAMTGHQPTPGTTTDILGNTTFAQHIDEIVEAMSAGSGVDVIRTDPAQRDHYRVILEETILKDGVKVIIADKECGITFQRRVKKAEAEIVKKRGFLPKKTYVNITHEVCEYCLECTMSTGCPGLTFVETDFGRKTQTDLSWCVGDLACAKVHACPSFEEITVIRSQKPEDLREKLDFSKLTAPQPTEFKSVWHAYLAGVGGMGIATSTATLVRAAHRQGYRVAFCDKNGLAIRNGGVYSHVSFYKDHELSPIIPYGAADLILGLDPLEAARSLDPKGNQRAGHPSKTCAIINSFKTPTILSLIGRDDFSVEEIEAVLKKYTRADRYFSCNLSSFSERYFGTKLYVNVMMLGAAFQAGLLPLTLENLEWGIRETLGKRAADNWLAFNLGRKIFSDLQQLPRVTEPLTYNDVITEKSAILREGKKGERLAHDYWRLTIQAVEKIRLDPESLRLLALRIYDLIQYEGVSLAQRYVHLVLEVFQRDLAKKNYAVTKAVLWNLHRVMAIKDEFYVPYLLTSEEKYARDRQRYNINPELGDRAIYQHWLTPEFAIGPFHARFSVKARPWMLRPMAKMKFLRKIIPGWHSKERKFRNWYIRLLNEFQPNRYNSYDAFVEIFRYPEQVRGYREIRYPKIEEAYKRVEEILQEVRAKEVAAQSATG